MPKEDGETCSKEVYWGWSRRVHGKRHNEGSQEEAQ